MIGALIAGDVWAVSGSLAAVVAAVAAVIALLPQLANKRSQPKSTPTATATPTVDRLAWVASCAIGVALAAFIIGAAVITAGGKQVPIAYWCTGSGIAGALLGLLLPSPTRRFYSPRQRGVARIWGALLELVSDFWSNRAVLGLTALFAASLTVGIAQHATPLEVIAAAVGGALVALFVPVQPHATPTDTATPTLDRWSRIGVGAIGVALVAVLVGAAVIAEGGKHVPTEYWCIGGLLAGALLGLLLPSPTKQFYSRPMSGVARIWGALVELFGDLWSNRAVLGLSALFAASVTVAADHHATPLADVLAATASGALVGLLAPPPWSQAHNSDRSSRGSDHQK